MYIELRIYCKLESSVEDNKASLIIKLTCYKRKLPSIYLFITHLSVTLTLTAAKGTGVSVMDAAPFGLGPQQSAVVFLHLCGLSGCCLPASSSSHQEEDGHLRVGRRSAPTPKGCPYP